MASGAALKVHSSDLPSREHIGIPPPAAPPSGTSQHNAKTMLSLGCSQPVTELCQGTRAGPCLPDAEWATFAMQLRISQSCTAVWSFSHPILFPVFFPFTGIRSSSCLECPLYFCSPSSLPPKDIPLNKSLTHRIPSCCLPLREPELIKVSQASLCQTFV